MERDPQISRMFGQMLEAIEILEGCSEFAALIPEVRTNLVYAKSGAQGPCDVLAINGRMTVLNGTPRAAGRPRWGASSHMARLIIELRKTDPSVNAGINFASNPHLATWLASYCKDRGLLYSVIDRSNEPEEFKGEERASMPWKVAEAIRAAGGEAPRLFYETGAVGKEDVSVFVGADPVEVAEEACRIARMYAASLRPKPKVGKIDLDTFTSFLLKRLGRKDDTVVVPPLTGVDAGVIDIGDGKVLITAEDPIFSIPGQPLEMFGWYTVHIGASDVAVMGVKPRYMTYTLLMPPETSDEAFRTIVDSIHQTALDLDIAIVGGHTGYYPGFATPVIGGISVFAVAGKDDYVTPAGARPGDDVILTKGPAIETVGILGVLREPELMGKYTEELIERAKALCKEMTVVKDCMLAMEAGGVTSMHDATEGGVMGGLFEIANASSVGMEIDEAKFIFPEEVKMVCEAFNIDALLAIAEGSLLLTAEPGAADTIIAKLEGAGIPASVIGTCTDDPKTRTIRRLDGTVQELEIPEQDPFWPVFFEGIQRSMG
jgi:hydrogenase maturation factor/predicted fused transcriptional regulator/phosphomethylpyrimidine kinase